MQDRGSLRTRVEDLWTTEMNVQASRPGSLWYVQFRCVARLCSYCQMVHVNKPCDSWCFPLTCSVTGVSLDWSVLIRDMVEDSNSLISWSDAARLPFCQSFFKLKHIAHKIIMF